MLENGQGQEEPPGVREMRCGYCEEPIVIGLKKAPWVCPYTHRLCCRQGSGSDCAERYRGQVALQHLAAGLALKAEREHSEHDTYTNMM